MVEGYDDRWGSPLQMQNSMKVGHKRYEMLTSLTVASFTQNQVPMTQTPSRIHKKKI